MEATIFKNYNKVLITLEKSGKTLCNCFVADSFWRRFKGLMMKPELPENTGLWLQKTDSIHTFFMKFPIDVLFLDQDNKIVAIIPAMPRRRVSKIYRKAKSVVELTGGYINSFDLKPGDQLILNRID